MRELGEREHDLDEQLVAGRRRICKQRSRAPPKPAGRRRRRSAPRARAVGEPRGERRLIHLTRGRAIDMERGARLSGARLAYLRGELVMVELALVRGRSKGPARRASSRSSHPFWCASGRLRDRMLPTPSSRSTAFPMTNCISSGPRRSRSRRFTPARSSTQRELPLRYAGFSSCFRREAGAAGKDTRGIFRVHQFDKVEMFVFTTAQESARAEHERILATEESLLGELGIPYRVVNIAVVTSAPRPPRSTTARRGCPRRSATELTSCSNRTDPRPAASRSASAARRRPVTANTITAPPSRSAVQSSRSLKTTSTRTARSRSRAPFVEFGAPAVIAAQS